MNITRRASAILGGLALTASLGVVTALPASAITTVTDVNFAGYGDELAVCDSVAAGGNVGFAHDQFCLADLEWDYQLKGGAGTGKYYYIHPHGDDSLCMTASTTQFGVIKLENCVSADQQFWINDNSGGEYHIENNYWGSYIYETGSQTLGMTFNCSYGRNSCSFSQQSA
jgi:hypothetical protein